MKNIAYVLSLLMLTLMTACSDRKEYVIAMSQCSEDIWREKLNTEMLAGTYLYDNVTLRVASANDDNVRQTEQINGFVNDGVDILIVAPNQMNTVTPAIENAYNKGIPVILFDRKTGSDKYTAFIGADNVKMGRTMGEYIASRLGGKGRVLEITGLKGSSPAIERHQGFADALKHYPGIELVAVSSGTWMQQSGRKAMEAMLDSVGGNIDYVFAHNDRMALGARQAAQARGLAGRIKFIGIDALPGKGGGIELVRDGVLDASYIYPTRGDMVMQLAMSILEKHPYQRENLMKTALVTKDNAEVLLMQAEEMNKLNDKLNMMHDRVNMYLTQYSHQKVYLMMFIIILVLLVLSFVAFYRTYDDQRAEGYDCGADAYITKPFSSNVLLSRVRNLLNERMKLKNIYSGAEAEEDKAADDPDTRFVADFRHRLKEHLSDSELNVETLAAELGLSRVQLYRKVKQLTGSSPVKIIRITRLKAAEQLLRTTSKTVSEISYDVGFSSPSYFTKCFKDYFGHLPNEGRGV